VKLTVVERYQSNRLLGYIVVAFRLMQEQKYVCGKQPKIVNLQQEGNHVQWECDLPHIVPVMSNPLPRSLSWSRVRTRGLLFKI